MPSLKPLNEQVIVITGASSGIGLATARAAAARGARLVLAARNEEALKTIEAELNTTAGQAVQVSADVGRREDVERIVATAVERFGGFDTWVNNAGVSIIGRLEEVSEEDSRRLFDTNFWGLVNGSLVAADHLRKRGGGALINLGSVLSDQALPLQGMYSASKHAVKGFTNALRMELEESGAGVSVTLIKPAGIDTPYIEHARKYTDQQPKLPPPVYRSEEVAEAILHAAAHQERDLYVGGGGKAMSAFTRTAPRVMDWIGEKMLMDQQIQGGLVEYPAGSLHQAGYDGRVRGDHPGYVMKSSLYTRASLHPWVTGALVVTAGALLAGWMGRRPGR